MLMLRRLRSVATSQLLAGLSEAAPGRLQTQGGAPALCGPLATLSQCRHASGIAGIHASAHRSTGAGEERNAVFHRAADLYLGGLRTKLEAALRQTEGESYDYSIEMAAGRLTLALPDGAHVSIAKNAEQEALVLDSNIHDSVSSTPDHAEVVFRLHEDAPGAAAGFSDGGEALHEFLEDLLARHLKVQLELEPERAPSGRDPS